jgi:hypothetical protein
VRPNGFWIFTVAILPNDTIDRHTAPHDVKAAFTPLNVLATHSDTYFPSLSDYFLPSHRLTVEELDPEIPRQT